MDIQLTLQNCNKDSGSVTSRISKIKSADRKERCILVRSSESVCLGKLKMRERGIIYHPMPSCGKTHKKNTNKKGIRHADRARIVVCIVVKIR
jgi:hypothetical protein